MTTEPAHRLAPGPSGLPVLGSARDFMRDFIGTTERGFAMYGDIVRYRVGPRLLHVLSHPDLAQEVLVDRNREFTKFPPTIGLGIVLGNGLITNDDHTSWLSQRRMMQPMFHRARIAAMSDQITRAGEQLLERWRVKYREGEVLDVHHEMMRVTLDIINRTMFSADLSGDATVVGPAVERGVEFVQRKVQNPWSTPRSWPTPRNLRFQRDQRNMDRSIHELIQSRRKRGEARGDLLDMLLDARDADTGEGMSDQQLRDEVITIFGAGHETTANALTWTWWLLSQHPAVLARLQEELDIVLAGRAPTMTDLPNLPYTAQVLNEVLRLYPSAPIPSPRRSTTDTTIRGYAIPANSRVIVSIYNIHRHPDFWRDPLRFDPDRFSPERSEKRHRLAFMPFGAGPRMCIGHHLAMIEGQLLIAMIAQKYELHVTDGHAVTPQMAITLKPRGGLRVTLQDRSSGAVHIRNSKCAMTSVG